MVPYNCDILISRYNTTINGIAPSGSGAGWYWWNKPPTGNVIVAAASYWVGFLNGQGGVLEATNRPWDASGSINEVVTGFAATSIFIVLITADDGGPSGCGVNGVAPTYWSAPYYGYAGSAVDNPVCNVHDNGASHGVAGAFMSLDYGIVEGAGSSAEVFADEGGSVG